MDSLSAENRAAWTARADALHDAAEAVLAAIDAHDAEEVFALVEQIERSCEHCHSQYWYPKKIPPAAISENQ